MVGMIGIDLGTSNSCAAYHDGREVNIIETAEGQRTMPSVISLFPDGVIPLTGRSAERALHSNANFTFRHVKRVIGQKFDDDYHASDQMTEGSNGEVAFIGPERTHSASELQSYLIKAMVDAAEIKFGTRPEGAVITVPANFGSRQQAATREAAVKAGLSLKRVQIMQEPAAAALAHGIDQEKFTTVAVCDIGGGTSDIAILRCGSNLNRTLGLDGSPVLGGVDFDQRIIKWVIDKWYDDRGQDLMAKPAEVMARVRAACEQAKIDLSTRDKTQIYLDHLTVDSSPLSDDEGVSSSILTMNYSLTKNEFVELTQDLIHEITSLCDRAVRDKAQLTVRDIDHVIMVGGMTRVPAIQEAITAYFGRAPLKNVVPEEAVARGAATYAAMLDYRIGGSVFEGVTPLSTGIENADGVMTVAVPRGTNLPKGKTLKRTLVATSHEDDQECCTIRIVQGEEDNARANSHLVTHHIPLEPGQEAGEPSFPVDFEYTDTGDLTVMVNGETVWNGNTHDV